MRLLSLTLENIKSYADPTTIELTSGLNAICGSNGSGKTTLLEAIGFTLFDFLPYNQAAFVREGQKAGTIRVRLVAADEREYEVVRRVGSSGQWYVSDLETNTRLAERGENVLDWIKTQALDSDAALDLKALFKDAVGVPQGMMTTDFLQAERVRKSIFNPLLRVEEYEDAWNKLRDTGTYLRNLTEEIGKEIARLEAETERLPGLEQEARDLDSALQAGERRLAILRRDWEAVKAAKAELELLAASLDALQGEVRDAVYQIGSKTAARDTAVVAREEAREAATAVARSQAGHDTYRAAQAALDVLEKERALRDDLQREHDSARAHLGATERHIDRLEIELQAVERDARAADELNDAVARQDAQEREAGTIDLQLQGAAELERRIDRAERAVAASGAKIAELRKRIEEATAAGTSVAGYDALVEEIRTIEAEQAALQDVKRRHQEALEAGKRLRDEADRLDKDIERAAALQSRIDEHSAVAAALETLRATHLALRDQETSVRAGAQYQATARANLEKGECPLLAIDCPVVKADRNALVRFDRHMADLEASGSSLQTQIAEAAGQVKLAEAADNEVRTLTLELAPLLAAGTQRSAVEAQLTEARRIYRELDEALRAAPARDAHLATLREQEVELRRQATLAARLPDLQESLGTEETALRDTKTDLEGLHASRAELTGLRERLKVIRGDLQIMNDPRSRQAALKANAMRRESLQIELEMERVAEATQSAELADVAEQLESYRDLDARIVEQRSLQASHRAAFETYLAHVETAGRLAEREEAVTVAECALAAAVEQEAALRETLAGVESSYDRERHERLREEERTIGMEIATTEGNRTRDLRDRESVERELRMLRERVQRLQAKRVEESELGRVARAVSFIRETIRAAGPAVTESLLSQISLGANEIFAEIMDDHAVELRWDTDYEILVQRGTESRKFAQLSGGEQMSAALAVRLALLREMSEVNFAFFDEPTQNMDIDRRTNLADQIGAVKGFEQLIVISHDDTFEHQTDNLIRLSKRHDETVVADA